MKKINQSMFALNRSSNCLNLMIKSIIYCSLTTLLLILTSCSSVRLGLNQFKEDKRSNLPQNIKSADEDYDLRKETSCIITVYDDSGTFFIGKEQVTQDQITNKIVEKIKGKTPDKRIVYIESTINVQYKTIVDLLDKIRKADVDKVGFVAYKEKNDGYITTPRRIEVKLPSEPKAEELEIVKPNPLTLVVSIDKPERLSLNNEIIGNIGETNTLTNKLSEIFKERENNGVLREGTNEVEKTVNIRASQSLKYGDVVKVIDAVKLAGGSPIGIQIDDLSGFDLTIR